KPEPDWFDPYPHDRYFAGGPADRQRNGIGDRNDHVGVAANDLASEIGKPLGMPLAGYRSTVRVCPSTLPRRRSSSQNAPQLRSPASLISVTEPAARNIAIRCRLARSCACARRVAAASNKPIVKSRLLTQSPRRRSRATRAAGGGQPLWGL